MLYFSAFADKPGSANQRLTKNVYTAIDNQSEGSKIRHHTSYQPKEPMHTNYHFFRPFSKGKKWIYGNEKLNDIHDPLGKMLKQILMTGKFDVIANLARIEIVPTRKEDRPYPHSLKPPFGKLLYNHYPESSPLMYASLGNNVVKEPYYGPQLSVAKSLPQLSVNQPSAQVAVSQAIIPQPLESKGYNVPGVVSLPGIQNIPSELPSLNPLPDHLPFTTDAVLPPIGSIGQSAQVPFENMFQQFQATQENSKEQSYMELSKLYDIMNAMKAIHTEQAPQSPSRTEATKPATATTQ